MSPLHSFAQSAYPECTKTPTESEVSAAKGAFEAGQVAFHEGDYDRAVLYWEDAFQRDCTAIALLLNLARAYELSRQNDQSVAALEAYLERNPTTEDRPSIEKRIQRLRSTSSASPAGIAAAPAEPAAQIEPAERTPASPKPTKPPPARPVWPVILTGGGVIATGVGLGLTISGQIAVDGYTSGLCSTQNANGAFECRAETRFDPVSGQDIEVRSAAQVEQDAQDALTQRNVGAVVTGVGAAAALGGAVAWWLLWRDSPASATLVPVIGKETVGLIYSGAF